MPAAVAVAFFASGFAGLMHQVAWSKLLVHIIGATAYAQAVVLSVFMGGLALGAALGGRWVDRRGRPLELYAALEVGIAAYCFVLPWLVDAAAGAYVAVAGDVFEQPALTVVLRFVLSFAVVFAPAVAMGATLPALVRHAVERVEETQHHVGLLYSVNSFGAVCGAGVAGFVALPMLGIQGALWSASFLNLVAAAVVLPRMRRLASAEGGETPAPSEPRGSRPKPAPPAEARSMRLALVALGLSGFAAMAYEVLFIRIIGLSFGSSAYSFTVMLMAFVTGIALGSAIVARVHVADPMRWFGWSQLAVVAALLVATPLVEHLPFVTDWMRFSLRAEPFGFALYQLGKALLCLAILLVPTACLGFGFPLVSRIQARVPEELGARVGTTYAWNTVGNVLGVLVTSLLLLPWLGLLGGLHLCMGLNATAGLLVLQASDTGHRRSSLPAAVAGLAALCGLYVVVGLEWLDPVRYGKNHLRADFDEIAARVTDERDRYDVWRSLYTVDPASEKFVSFDEDAHTAVLVWGEGHSLSLTVNTKTDAGTGTDMTTQMLLGHAPLFAAPDAVDALVIGYGAGFTVRSVLTHPVERVDVVEISEAVMAADAFFAEHNDRVLADPRVHVHVEDGQSFLRAVPRTYDVIISEPSNPWIAGIGDLFTVEFFETVRSKLTPGGVFSLWFHTYDQKDETIQLVLRSLHAVFPHVEIFRDLRYMDLIAVATAAPLDPQFAAIEDRFERAEVRDDLTRIGVTNLAGLLLHHGVPSTAQLFGEGELNRTSHQRLEYMAARGLFDYQDAVFIEESDPLYQRRQSSDLWLDRYLAYRAQVGDPVAREELLEARRISEAIGSYTKPVTESLSNRARKLAPQKRAAGRPARGLVPEAGEMGFYESIYWAQRAFDEDRLEASIAHLERARQLRPQSTVYTELFETLDEIEAEREAASSTN